MNTSSLTTVLNKEQITLLKMMDRYLDMHKSFCGRAPDVVSLDLLNWSVYVEVLAAVEGVPQSFIARSTFRGIPVRRVDQ